MLYSYISDTRITAIPYQDDYRRWRRRLDDDEHAAIIDELTRLIGGEQIKTSSWMPGKDWTNTVF